MPSRYFNAVTATLSDPMIVLPRFETKDSYYLTRNLMSRSEHIDKRVDLSIK